MATITEIVAAFQVVNANIDGIATAPPPDSYPPTLLGAKLPFAITLPGPARWYGGSAARSGLGSYRKAQRTYVVRIYLAVAEPNVAEPFAQGLTLLEAVGNTYRDAQAVNGALVLAGGASVVYTSTDGLGDLGFLATLPYGGQAYYGFTFHVPVLEPA